MSGGQAPSEFTHCLSLHTVVDTISANLDSSAPVLHSAAPVARVLPFVRAFVIALQRLRNPQSAMAPLLPGTGNPAPPSSPIRRAPPPARHPLSSASVFEAFQETDYRRFWSAQFVSNIGSWMQTLAQGWLVYRLTDSAFLLGLVGFASSIPALFLMLPGGVLADQLDRRRTLRISQWAQALAALFLAVSIRTGQITVWQIVIAALVNGTAMSFSAPAYQAMVVDLLDDRSRLPNAVAMNSLQFNFSRVVGPLIAGVTLAAYGAFWCFFFNAISFLPLIWVLKHLKHRQQYVAATAPMWARLTEGFRYVRTQRTVIIVLGCAAAASLFGFPYLNLMPVVARSLFHDDARGLGVLMGGVGVGALAGSLALSIRTPRSDRMLPIILTSMTVFGVALASVGFVRREAFVLALLAICGAAMVVCMALCNTSIQQRIPDEMRGRVLSMYTFAFFAVIPFGNLFSGIVAEHRGIALTLAALGGGLLMAVTGAAFARAE
jgi:MFS family permease